MARSCAIIPKVLNKKGEKVDSKLFKDLLSYLSNKRALVVDLYKKTKTQEFIQKWLPKLEVDENGEPTVRSMLKKTNLGTYIDESRVLEKLNRSIGFYKKGMNRPALWVKNNENRRKLSEKAIKFNQTSEFRDEYVARVIEIPDTESSRTFLGVRVYKNNKLYATEAKEMEYNEALNTRLREILAEQGIKVGVLDELERRQGINGVTDFSKAKNAAEGIVELIRIAEGIRGERVLPEEFAHFALEAMGTDNPLLNRLINLIVANNLAKEIIGEEYDRYEDLYERNQVKLAKEAAGKLLAKHLLQEFEIPNKPYKNLLQRVIASIKNFFRKLSADSIQKAMIEVDKSLSTLARNLLEGNVDNISIKNITDTTEYYNLAERVARDKNLLESIIKNELKRFKVYEARNPSSSFAVAQEIFITELESNLASNNEIDGIYSFIDNALSTFKSLNNRLIAVQNSSTNTLNAKAKVLRDIRNYIYSYDHIINNIREALLEEEKLTDNRYGTRVRIALDEAAKLIEDLRIEYKKVSMPLFVEFIKPFVGNNLVVPFGKYKGMEIKAEDIVKIAHEDISFFDRWLDSMADSSSYILKVLDQAVKKSKELARLDTIEVQKKLEAAGLKLEKAGFKDTSWMFERDSAGNLTGRYITEINHGLFREAMRKMYKDLEAKYGKNPTGEDAKKAKAEKEAWFDANMETVNNQRRPKLSIYASEAYKNLKPAQKEFYKTVLDIKAELDSYLPENYTTLTNTVKIRKDLIERVKDSDDIKAGTKAIWESVKDQFIRRSDDTNFSDKAAVKDFEGREVQILPIYYTKLREGESHNDISTDVVSTMIAYTAMANDFKEMNKVIDVLELSRDMLLDNFKIESTKGGKPLVEKFTALGRKVEEKVLKPKHSERILERLNDFFEMQVYSRYMADEGTFGDSVIDKAKTADFINKLTSLNTLAFNVLSGISNVATGGVMMRIEAFSKEFFRPGHLITADRIYGKEMPALMAELGNRVKTSKLALWSELFNVLQDYETDVRTVNFDRKTWFSRMANSSSLFVINNAGEHWMQHRTSLALAAQYEMKAPDGTIVSLWEAMEPVYIDPNNKSLGATLEVKKGYTKKDGTAFTKDDIIKFSRKTAAINERMHGIYNKLDRSAIQRLAIGRMAIMFRKWIKPSLNRRFKSATYNFDLEAWTEGYYLTTGRFLWQLAKELKEGQFSIIANFRKLNNTEKANIKRAITEVGHLVILMAVLALMEGWDDEDRPWLAKMAEYQARRLYTEIGAMTPGVQMIKEGLRIVKSPAAGVNTIEDIVNLVGLINPYNYEWFAGEEALLQSGRYKGESKAIKLFYESPLVPMNKTIYKAIHPEESIPFYKQ